MEQVNDNGSISGIATRLGKVAAHFEPGTSFYEKVVQQVVVPIRDGATRDDIEHGIDSLRSVLAGHLTDAEMQEMRSALDLMKGWTGPLSVDAFRIGFLTGFGWELPQDGHVSGRTLSSGRRS
jgi:hypothetical protein